MSCRASAAASKKMAPFSACLTPESEGRQPASHMSPQLSCCWWTGFTNCQFKHKFIESVRGKAETAKSAKTDSKFNSISIKESSGSAAPAKKEASDERIQIIAN